MMYTPGYSISFSKKPPYIKVERKEISRTYPIGSRMILNELITQVSEILVIKVRTNSLAVS